MLTKERRGEIAVLLLKRKIREEGIRLKPNDISRNIGTISKEVGIPHEELSSFMKVLLEEMFDEAIHMAFGKTGC